MMFPTMILAQPAAVTVAVPPVDAAAQAAVAARVGAAAQPPQPPITAQDVAQYIDPGQVAAYVPAPDPVSDRVAIFNDLFNVFETAAIATMFAVGMFLLARIIHAFMIHRSVRKAIEAKSGDAPALIDKLNKPYEMTDVPEKRTRGGDDRIALVLIAVGFAILGFGLIQGGAEDIRVGAGAALFPIFVGAALLVSRRMQKRELAEEQAAGGQ